MKLISRDYFVFYNFIKEKVGKSSALKLCHVS